MVTPFNFVVERVFALGFALARNAAVVSVLVSITDDLMFFGEIGAGLLALLAFLGAGGRVATDFAGSFFTSTLRVVLLADLPALPALTVAAGLLALLAGTGFFAAGTFLTAILALDFAAGAGFALVATFGADFLTGFAATFDLAAGLARAGALVDLAVDLDFCVDFAIFVLTL